MPKQLNCLGPTESGQLQMEGARTERLLWNLCSRPVGGGGAGPQSLPGAVPAGWERPSRAFGGPALASTAGRPRVALHAVEQPLRRVCCLRLGDNAAFLNRPRAGLPRAHAASAAPLSAKRRTCRQDDMCHPGSAVPDPLRWQAISAPEHMGLCATCIWKTSRIMHLPCDLHLAEEG